MTVSVAEKRAVVKQKNENNDLPWVVLSYSAQFEQHLQEHDRSPATVRAYLIGLKTFETWLAERTGEALDPARITPLDVRAFKSYLLDVLRLKAASVNSYLAGLRAFCRWAQEAGHAEHDPSANIKAVKQAPRAPKWLTNQQQFALLRAVEQEVQLSDVRAKGDKTHPAYIWARRDRAIIKLLLNAGLRLSEAAALRVDDVTLKPRSGHVIVRKGKGTKERTVELNKDARAALTEWLAVRPQVGHEALFVSQKGRGPLSSRALSDVVCQLGERAGLDIHPHLLRHSFAKNLLNNGVGLEVAADLLGHENLETTRVYTTPSAADRQRAVEKISWEE